MRFALPVRIGLLALGIPQAAIGVWALVSTRGWYDEFPGFRPAWLPTYGAYDQHLAFDVGATFLALGVLLAIAAWRPERTLVTVALAVYLVYAVPHWVFHLAHDDGLATADRILDGVVLTVTVVGALGLIWVARDQRSDVTTGT